VAGEPESEGYALVTKLNNVIRECTLLQTLNPFRLGLGLVLIGLKLELELEGDC
jgi:hypothetical protein